VFRYVTATGLLTALSTFQVVCRIEGLASRAGVVLPNFFEPLFIANRLDSFKIVPKLHPVRHCRLKQFQFIAGILFTFATKVDVPFCRTSEHFAFPTVRQPFSGTTAVALALFLRPISLSCKPVEPFGVFSGGNKP
jgi:hypothetical protein